MRMQQPYGFQKWIKAVLVWICAFLLEYFYIATDYKKAHHAFAVVFLFACLIVSFTLCMKKKEGLERHGILVSFCCGLVLSSTFFAGIMAQDEYFYTIGTCQGIIRAAAYLGVRTVLFGVFSLGLFQWLTGRRKNARGGGKIYILEMEFSNNLVSAFSVLASILCHALSGAVWRRLR